jgi:hypothetical protein
MEKLSSSLTRKLVSLPETGMGFQIVEAIYSDYQRRDAIVLNGTFIEPIVGDVRYMMRALMSEDVSTMEKSAHISTRIIDVNLRSMPTMFKAARYDESAGADQASVTYTKAGEIFIRFSSFLEDIRITEDGGLVPGTYATTNDDATYCLDNHIDPIARYALPSTSSIKYEFQIEPPAKIETKRGIVQPANDQPGGGIEVLFTKGSPAATVTHTYELS